MLNNHSRDTSVPFSALETKEPEPSARVPPSQGWAPDLAPPPPGSASECRVFRKANRLTSVVTSRRPRQSADAEGVWCGDRYQPQHGLLHQRRYGAAEHADWRVMSSSPCIFTLSQWQFCTRKIHCWWWNKRVISYAAFLCLFGVIAVRYEMFSPTLLPIQSIEAPVFSWHGPFAINTSCADVVVCSARHEHTGITSSLYYTANDITTSSTHAQIQLPNPYTFWSFVTSGHGARPTTKIYRNLQTSDYN